MGPLKDQRCETPSFNCRNFAVSFGVYFVNKNVIRGLAMVGALAGSVASQAAAIDVAGAVTDIGAQAAPVGLVGVACLLVYGAVKAFTWVRGALK